MDSGTTSRPQDTTVVGHSSSLSFDEALRDAANKLPPPRQGADFVEAKVASISIMKGGFTNGVDLRVSLDILNQKQYVLTEIE